MRVVWLFMAVAVVQIPPTGLLPGCLSQYSLDIGCRRYNYSDTCNTIMLKVSFYSLYIYIFYTRLYLVHAPTPPIKINMYIQTRLINQPWEIGKNGFFFTILYVGVCHIIHWTFTLLPIASPQLFVLTFRNWHLLRGSQGGRFHVGNHVVELLSHLILIILKLISLKLIKWDRKRFNRKSHNFLIDWMRNFFKRTEWCCSSSYSWFPSVWINSYHWL